MNGWSTNFHKWKEIWIYKRSLNWFLFQTRKHQGKRWLWWKMKMKKLERRSIVCSKREKNKQKKRKPWKKGRKKEKKPKVNLFLTHVNHTFLILDLQIGPQAFRHIHYTIRKNVFLLWKKVQFKVQFASNWSLGFWSLDPCLRWP